MYALWSLLLDYYHDVFYYHSDPLELSHGIPHFYRRLFIGSRGDSPLGLEYLRTGHCQLPVTLVAKKANSDFVDYESGPKKELHPRCFPQILINGKVKVEDLYLVGGDWNIWMIFSIYWEFHSPNWRSHIFQRGRSTTNQIWCKPILTSRQTTTKSPPRADPTFRVSEIL